MFLVESEIESIYYKISDNKDLGQYYSSLARNCLDLEYESRKHRTI